MVALRSSPPPSLGAPTPRPKYLRPVLDIGHIRSDAKRSARGESREILVEAMKQERALVLDLADALDVDERGASRAISGRLPIDISDLLCLASSGRGGARLARRLLALLGRAVDRIDLSHD